METSCSLIMSSVHYLNHETEHSQNTSFCCAFPWSKEAMFIGLHILFFYSLMKVLNDNSWLNIGFPFFSNLTLFLFL